MAIVGGGGVFWGGNGGGKFKFPEKKIRPI